MVIRRKDSKGRVLKEGEMQRKDGSYDFRWRTSDGKRHSVYAKTLDKLREKEEKIRCDKSDGIRIEAKYLVINDIFDLWAELKRGLKDNTFQNYQYMYRTFVYPTFGKTKLYDLKNSDVKRFYNYLVDNRNLKIRTLESVHSILFQVLELAVEEDYIRKNPTKNALKELKQIHSLGIEKKKALTRQEQELFTSFLSTNKRLSKWRPIFTIMINTGLRVGELTGLRWQDIDFEKILLV